MSVELPPLPEPNCCEIMFGGHRGTLDYFTADQLSAYARAAVDAALEAAAVKCEQRANILSGPNESDGEYAVMMNCAAAIRAMRSGVEHI